ncbi:DUF481 domain-containing protein [Altericroceibacterium xinjiangense]|uniref:DUF481 domain-containing protein n=1 Tax=Altericroceibacterium xinjiangense TaxID=762261 RepID=UPI001F49AA1E|nr:DUF481 domain-containing protein [Altericroceibacterium xinjiangense]
MKPALIVTRSGMVLFALAMLPLRAHAELPDPVRAMIEAAIATGDPAKVTTVVEIAEQTNPDGLKEIAVLHRGFLDRQARLARVQEEREKADIRQASLLENWGGKGQIGAFQSSGNSPTAGISASLALAREGLTWTHKLSGAVDYQSSSGQVTREQYLFAYEPRYKISPALFVFGLGQFESDPVQGFSSRYALSAGIGGRVLDREDLALSIKTGPTWRRTDFLTGPEDNHLAGLAALDLDWQVTPRISLTEDANLVIEQGNTSVLSTTGLETGIGNDLKARVSYTFDYDSDPPAGAVTTDTLTRFTLVYDF